MSQLELIVSASVSLFQTFFSSFNTSVGTHILFWNFTSISEGNS